MDFRIRVASYEKQELNEISEKTEKFDDPKESNISEILSRTAGFRPIPEESEKSGSINSSQSQALLGSRKDKERQPLNFDFCTKFTRLNDFREKLRNLEIGELSIF